MTKIPDSMPTLSAGAHPEGSGQACVMEYVSMLAGEAWSDHPTCTHPILAAIARTVNDAMTDKNRHKLIPLINRLFGTAADPGNMFTEAAHVTMQNIAMNGLFLVDNQISEYARTLTWKYQRQSSLGAYFNMDLYVQPSYLGNPDVYLKYNELTDLINKRAELATRRASYEALYSMTTPMMTAYLVPKLVLMEMGIEAGLFGATKKNERADEIGLKILTQFLDRYDEVMNRKTPEELPQDKLTGLQNKLMEMAAKG